MCLLLRETRLMVISPIGILWHAPKLSYFVSFVTPLRNGNIFENLNSHVKKQHVICQCQGDSGKPEVLSRYGAMNPVFPKRLVGVGNMTEPQAGKKAKLEFQPRGPSWRLLIRELGKHEVLRSVWSSNAPHWTLKSSLTAKCGVSILLILMTFRTQCGLFKASPHTPQTTLKLHVYGPYYSSDI